MARKKIRLTPEENSAVTAAEPSTIPNENAISEPVQAFEERESTRASARTAKARLSVPLNEDGTPDLAACRAETLAKLRAMVSDPKVAEALGVSGMTPEQIVTEADVSQLLDLVGGIEGTIFAWLGKIDGDIAAKHAYWTPEQKALVLKPAQNVISKHAASLMWYLRYRDEVALSLLFITITRAKFQGAKFEMSLRREGKIPPAPGTEQQSAPQPQANANGKEFIAPGENVQ